MGRWREFAALTMVVMVVLDSDCTLCTGMETPCCHSFQSLRLRGGALRGAVASNDHESEAERMMDESEAEKRMLQDMGLGGSEYSSNDDEESIFENSLINGTLDVPADAAFTCLLAPEHAPSPHEEHSIVVNFYDLAIGGVRNISQCYTDVPNITGFWQIGVCVHEMEWTFCAHRGVCYEQSGRDTGYGNPMCSLTVGSTRISHEELSSIMLELNLTYPAESFDAWTRTSIDFADELVQQLTKKRLPRQVTVPIPLYVEDDEMEMSDVAVHNVTVAVTHFPPELDRKQGFRLASMFRLWGKRLPTKMRLGPQYEPIGPFLPTVADGYREPPEGTLFVGMPAEAWLLSLRDRAQAASRQRIRGYLRAMDMLLTPEQLAQAADTIRKIRANRAASDR